MFTSRIRRSFSVIALALTLLGVGGGAVAFGIGTSPGISTFTREMDRGAQSAASASMFLKLGDIDGESRDDSHGGEIDVLSFG